MDLFKSYYDNKTKDYEITVSNVDKAVYLCLRHKTDKQRFILVKRFNTRLDYERFLTEAVVLRCSAKMKSVKDCRQIVKNMCSFLDDDENKYKNFSL